MAQPTAATGGAAAPALAGLGLLALVVTVFVLMFGRGGDDPGPTPGSPPGESLGGAAAKPGAEPVQAGETLQGEVPEPAGAIAAEPRSAPAPVERAVPAGLRPVPELKPGAPGVTLFSSGVRLPTLNGIETPTKVVWSPDRPWSPVVGVGSDNGWDWYVHADGTWSTTAMVPTNGVEAPTGLVRAVLKSVPIKN